MRHLIACLLCILYSSLVPAGEKLTILTEQSYPLSYTLEGNDDGEVIGYGVELVKAMMAETDLEYEITVVPWKRAIHTLQNGRNVLVFAMTRTKEREKRYHWVGKIISVEYSLYGFKKYLKALPTSLDAAKNLRIGVIRDDVISEYLSQKGFTNLVPVIANARNFKMSQRGRIDLFPYSLFGFEVFARRNGFDPDEYSAVIALPDISTDMYIVLGLNSDEGIVTQVQDAYQKIVNNGRYKKIIGSLRP